MTLEEALDERIAFQKRYSLVIPGKIWTQAEIEYEEHKRLKSIEALEKIKEGIDD